MNASNQPSNGTAPVEISSVRAARKEQAAKAKEAKAAVNKSSKSAKPRLKWTLDGDRDAHNRAQQHAVGVDGSNYKITGSEKEWKAVVTKTTGEKSILVEKVSYIKAYQACVSHHVKTTSV